MRASGAGPIQLEDVTALSGIEFQHTDGGSGENYLMEAVSAGLATLDYDLDGDLDIYFVNGAPLQGTPIPDPPPRNALYRNDGKWGFVDVTEQAGVGDTGFGLGVTAGDYNNDGHPDLYVNNYGPNVLYRNNGDGSFSMEPGAQDVAAGNKVGGGVSFLDMDSDGDLDLYVANYIKFSYDMRVTSTFRGIKAYPGPLVFPPEPDDLFRNNGDGTWTNVSAEAGISAHAEYGMGTVASDFDEDGDTDVFVANDSTRNLFFVNDGSGKFSEQGLLAGVAYDYKGDVLGSMGVDSGDFDNDGTWDLFQTSYQDQLTALYMNLAAGLFEDVTLRTNAGDGTFHQVNWGTGFIDFDNDGWRDLFIANGHIHKHVEQFNKNAFYRVRNQVLRNLQGKRFVDVSAVAGSGLEPLESSRGAAFDDLDNDGDVDAVILNSCTKPTVIRNVPPGRHHWVQFELRGRTSNRDGVGTRVTIEAGGKRQAAEVISGRGYQSHFGSRLHFGLADADRIERLEIRWHGGGSELYEDIPVDRLYRFVQGHKPEQNAAPATSRPGQRAALGR